LALREVYIQPWLALTQTLQMRPFRHHFGLAAHYFPHFFCLWPLHAAFSVPLQNPIFPSLRRSSTVELPPLQCTSQCCSGGHGSGIFGVTKLEGGYHKSIPICLPHKSLDFFLYRSIKFCYLLHIVWVTFESRFQLPTGQTGRTPPICPS
jgi:hypothetical protein